MINRKLGLEAVSFRMDMGRGFLFLSTPGVMVTKSVLALTPFATPWGQCIFQEWEPNFNPDYPKGLKLPTWISLTKLPHEFKPVEGLIAAILGPVYQADQHNYHLRDPRFCVGLDLTQGWPSALAVRGIENQLNTIIINYDHAPIRCRFCLSLAHKVADCEDLKANGGSSPIAPPRASGPRPQPQAPATAVALITPPRQCQAHAMAMDMATHQEDGFTEVRHRKARNTQSPPHRQSAGHSDRHALAAHPPPAPNPPMLTSDQVMGLLESHNEEAAELPMAWSPGRYGRNPGSKRVAGNSSQQSSPTRSNGNSKKLIISPPEHPQPAQVRIPDSEGGLCILYDVPPAVAFPQIEAIKRNGNQMQPSSASSSSLSLDHFPTQHLGSPVSPMPRLADPPRSQGAGPAALSPPPDPFLLSDVTSKAGRQDIPDLNDSGSETSSKVNSLRIAASYKAKWEAVNRRLDAAATNSPQPVSNPSPNSSAL
ncbi:hypothetical protein M758_UG084500 [Ceratodon purpureus]|nr:hypothetical protein M758_UG084500 [Ceratodon purpureus]